MSKEQDSGEPAPDSSEAEAALDPAVLSELGQWGHEPGQLLDEMLEVFAHEAPQLLVAVEEAVRCHRHREARNAAHQLVGVSYLVGALRLARECKNIERHADDRDKDRLSRALATTRREYAAAVSAVEVLLRK